MQRDRGIRSVKPTEHTLEESYASFCNHPLSKDSPLESSSFLHDEWAPLTNDQLKRCLPEEYSETFDGKADAMQPATSPPLQEASFRVLLSRLKSNSTSDRAEALKELIRLTSQGSLTIQQSVVIDFGALFRDSDAGCFDAALACYQSLMKQCIVKPQFIPIAVERAYRGADSKNFRSFLSYLFAHHAKLYEQLSVEALLNPNKEVQQAFMWSLGELVTVFGVGSLNYLTTYMDNFKSILARPESTQLKQMTVKLLQQCMKAEGPDCIMSQLKDLPEEAVMLLQTPQQNNSFSSSAKDKSTSVARQSMMDPLKKFNEEWVVSLDKTHKQSDKVKLLEQLLETLKDSKLLTGQFKHLTNMIKHLLNSNNLCIYLIAIRITTEMARCLGRSYEQTALQLLPCLLTKLRDKKPQVTAELSTCLNTFAEFLQLEQLLPIIREGLSDKNANMKVHTIGFLERVIVNTIQNCPSRQLAHKYNLLQSVLPEMFDALLKDNSSEVRTAASECLRRMSKHLPSDRFPVLLQGSRNDSPDAQTSRRAAIVGKSHSNEKQKQPKGQGGAIAKLLAKINDQTLSIEQKKEAIVDLERYFQEGDAANFSRLACLQEVGSCLRKCLMVSPKLLFKSLVLCVGKVYAKVGVHMKMYSKPLVHTMIEALKTEYSRKDLLDSLRILCICVGLDMLMPPICSALESEKVERAGVLQFCVANSQLFQFSECAMLSKGLVICMNDKVQEVRQLAVEFANKKAGHLDLAKMRHFAYRIHTKVPKELETVFKHLEQRTRADHAYVRPAETPEVRRSLFATMSNNQPSGNSQGNNDGLASLELSPNLFQDSSSRKPQHMHDLLRPDTQFDPLLSNEEWLGYAISFEQERNLKTQLGMLFKHPYFDRMVALEPSTLQSLVAQLRQLCQAVRHNTYFLRLYPLLLKWVLLRLWNGCRQTSQVIFLADEIISIMKEERNESFERLFALCIAILREYLLQLEPQQEPRNEVLSRILTNCVELLSGQHVLVAVVGEYQKDLKKIHPWVGESRIKLQRSQWLELMKDCLLKYMTDQLILAHLSQIEELRSHSDIVQYLFSNCPEDEILGYGFSKPVKKQEPSIPQMDLEECIAQQQEPSKEEQESQLMAEEEQQQQTQPQPVTKFVEDVRPRKTTVKTVHFEDKEQSGQASQIQKDFGKAATMTFNPEKRALPRSKQGSHYRRVTEQLQLSLNTFHSGCNSSFIDQLDRMTEGDLQSISYFSEILTKPTLKISAELKGNADYILASFVKLCLYILEIRQEVPLTTLLQCYQLLLAVTKCQYVMLNAPKALPYFIEFSLHQTVHEEEQRGSLAELLKIHPQLRDDCLVRIVNTIMLRIIDNCPVQWLVEGLIAVVMKAVQLDGSMRLKDITYKCLKRATQRYSKECCENDFASFALMANNFYCEMETLIMPEDPYLLLLVEGLRAYQKKFSDKIVCTGHLFESNKFLTEYANIRPNQPYSHSSLTSNRLISMSQKKLSTEALHRLEEFRKEYPEFDPKEHLPEALLEPEEVISPVPISTISSQVNQHKNIFEEIREDIRDTVFSDISEELTYEIKTSQLSESVKAARERLKHLQARILRTQRRN